MESYLKVAFSLSDNVSESCYSLMTNQNELFSHVMTVHGTGLQENQEIKSPRITSGYLPVKSLIAAWSLLRVKSSVVRDFREVTPKSLELLALSHVT